MVYVLQGQYLRSRIVSRANTRLVGLSSLRFGTVSLDATLHFSLPVGTKPDDAIFTQSNDKKCNNLS